MEMPKVTLALTLPPTALAPASTPAWACAVKSVSSASVASPHQPRPATVATFTGRTSQRPCPSYSQCWNLTVPEHPCYDTAVWGAVQGL